jgi:alpha-1,3-glucosyltransferase
MSKDSLYSVLSSCSSKMPPKFLSSLSYVELFLFAIAVKSLFFQCYFSTDFEVHRHWKALTVSLPFNQWYTESSHSPWTLDYPVLFACFEYLLGNFAKLFNLNQMVDINNVNFLDQHSLLFMRCSVLLGDFLLCILMMFYSRVVSDPYKSQANKLFFIAICLSKPILIVDNIHFQYNLYLSVFLIASIISMENNRFILASILYCLLIFHKHIYLYYAPAYFAYLVNFHVRKNSRNFFALAFVVTSVFVVLLAPIVLSGQFFAFLNRLFPVQRGLVHDYWAGNFYAIFLSAQKVLRYLPSDYRAKLAGIESFCFKPGHTAMLTLSAYLVVILSLLKKQERRFSVWLIAGGFVPFLFGYHVHEKAILLITVPFLWTICNQSEHKGRYKTLSETLSVTASFSLLPLLFREQEFWLKWTLMVTGIFFEAVILDFFIKKMIYTLTVYASIYFLGSLVSESFPFLPLLLTSLISACSYFYIFLQTVI